MTYDAEQAARFCAVMASTTDSIATICKRKDMPSKATVFRWRNEEPEFAAMYKTAKEAQVDLQFDECVEIADECKANKIAIQKAKLQIYARIEVAQRLKPKQYGTRVTAEHTGADGGPLVVEIIRHGTNPAAE